MKLYLVEKELISDLLERQEGIEIPNVRLMSDEEIDFDPIVDGSIFRKAFLDREVSAKFAVVLV
ncbi:MAG: hypothetical protein FWE31_02725 [Firmicutes bacterium]|nr:hypothetical protein [Bacillota bacterium]